MLNILFYVLDGFFWIVIVVGALIMLSTVLNIIQYRTNIFNNFYNPIKQCPAASQKLEFIMGKFLAGEIIAKERDAHFTMFYDSQNDRHIKVITNKKSYFFGCIVETDVAYFRPENKTAKEFLKFLNNLQKVNVPSTNEVTIE